MKKIGFVTTNKVLAQSLASAVKSRPGLDFELFLLLNPKQAALDAEILNIETAVVDMADTALEESYETLRRAVPDCRLLLLVPQGDKDRRKAAVRAIKSKNADDFVFCDTSLDYLFAKLAAI